MAGQSRVFLVSSGSGHKGLNFTLLAIGLGLLVCSIGIASTREDVKLGVQTLDDGTRIERTLEGDMLTERVTYADGRTDTTSSTHREDAIMLPLGILLGVLFAASGFALAWLSGGRRYIDAQNRVFVTEVPFLGASRDSIDDFLEVRLSEVSYRGQHGLQHVYPVKVVGRRSGNDLDLPSSENLRESRRLAKQVAAFTGLPFVDELPEITIGGLDNSGFVARPF